LLAALVLCGAAGCGGLTSVEGKVVFKDGSSVKPLAGGLVVFEPLAGAGKTAARGAIQEDGSFKLGTHREDDGAAPGKYRVHVTPPAPTVAQLRKGNPPRVIHPRYQKSDASPLEFTVTSGKNEFTVAVERP
jgi:hypothetical protein